MIVVEPFLGKSVIDHRVEIVERKGRGHPDSICDAVMDSVSVALCREYRKAFGTILHHNIDKSLLAAGSAAIDFGGGVIKKPMELTIGDRATFGARGRKIPVREIAVDAARAWFRKNLRFVDPDEHVRYRVILAPGSEELTDIFDRPGAVHGANDTSALIGFYPLSPTEQVVLGIETFLNSSAFKRRFPDTGEDIKVMGLRTGTTLDVTIAMPFISGFIENEPAYFRRKKAAVAAIERFVRRYRGFSRISIALNALDHPGRGIGGVYLSLLGTSAESADSGQVGRGNRVNGLISVNRPMGTEAAAGKNPVSHVGKIYNVFAHRMAETIYRNVKGVREVYVFLLSRIGEPITSPQMATAQVLTEKGVRLQKISGEITSLLQKGLDTLPQFCDSLAKGRFPVC